MPRCRCYTWSNTAATHSVAQSNCAALGGNLAVFGSYEEHLAVEQYLKGAGQWAHLDATLWWGHRLAGLVCIP
jgi:hypothetical protein